MIPKAYAHSLPGKPQSEWQPLEEHLQAVAEKAREFASAFGSGDWGYNAGWLHDLGKTDGSFQSYLLRENGLDDSEYDSSGGSRINHSSAGAAFAEEKDKLSGRILAYLIAGHHAGLPDWYPADTGNAALQIRLKEGKENLERIYSQTERLLTNLQPLSRPPDFLKKSEDFHLWIRILYSCLVDADFLDTEQFMNQAKPDVRGHYPTLENLAETFFKALDLLEKEKKTNQTPVNSIRAEIRQACEIAAMQAPGFFSLTVPTGGGKTLSSMAFAFRHALKYGRQRIIYVIPYTSIIEQTAKTFADIFCPENVVEHHSNLAPEKETQRSRLAAENWDAPIIVTTNVQFFESLYAAKSSRCRKLHNIINSIVILDEAQLLPPELLTPCVDALNQLVRNYSVTIILSTATQPALPRIDSITEIIPPSANLYQRLKRVDYHFPVLLNAKPVAWDSLAKELQKHDQVLCVVNTRRDCYDLFKLMPDGTIHLSALMCGAHRSKNIAEIKQNLQEGKSIRVISTQLVEAGVDIDFPVVYRAFAGLSSIAQAAGRCNREGKLNAGQVHIFMPPKSAPRGLLLKGENTTRELCALPNFDPQQPDSFPRYFSLFYSKVNDTGSRFHDWLVKDVNPNLFFQFRTAAENFKLIDDQAQCPVIVRYGGSDNLLNKLRFAGPTRETMRHLQRYTVNLPMRMADIMLANGLLEEVESNKAPGIIAQCNMKLYDDKTGLDIYRENLPVDDLIQ